MVVAPLAVGCLAAVGPSTLSQQAAVAAVSIAASLLALVPGMVLPPMAQRGNDRKRAQARAGMFVIGCAAAMAIRGVCTVALVVAAGYQMGPNPADKETIRFLSLSLGFWYVLATSVEVILLARGGRRLDRVSARPGTHISRPGGPASDRRPPSSLVF